MIREQILLRRREKDYTQDELAEKAGVSRNSVSMIEKGKYNPTVEQLQKICVALEMELQVSAKRWESFVDGQDE